MNTFSDFINSFLFSYKFWFVFLLICGILLSQHLLVVINCLNTAATGKTKYVLITDCDSELGYRIATKLCASKIYIIAGCSDEENARKLEEDINFNGYAFHLDVRNQDHVLNIYHQMKEHLEYIGLWGIVHTKKAYSSGPIEFENIENLNHVISTNVLAMVNITKFFMPWLKKMKGRIVCFTNSNERLTTYTSSINIATSAIESFAYSFKREMEYWNVSSHLIDIGVDVCENHDLLNDMWTNKWKNISDVTKQQYGEDYVQKCISNIEDMQKKYNMEIKEIVENVNHALLSSNPRYKYHSSYLRKFWVHIMEIIPENMKDMIMEFINPLVIPQCFVPIKRNKIKRY